jgi:hypothetical protein
MLSGHRKLQHQQLAEASLLVFTHWQFSAPLPRGPGLCMSAAAQLCVVLFTDRHSSPLAEDPHWQAVHKAAEKSRGLLGART